MRLFALSLTLAALGFAVAPLAVKAETITVAGTGLTSIGGAFGLPDPLVGAQYSIAETQGAERPLMRFELSGLGTINGDGALTFTVVSVWPENSITPTLDLYTLTQAYDPTTVTISTVGIFGTLLGTLTPTFINPGPWSESTPAGQTVTFTIGQALLQSWVNSPGTNFGLMLIERDYLDNQGHSDISWGTPTLTVDAVPEPTTLALLGAGAAAAAVHRRRRA